MKHITKERPKAGQKVFVTKYGLAGGISQRVVAHTQRTYVVVKWPGALGNEMLLHENEWFYTERDARNQLRLVVRNKINSHKRAISKLTVLMQELKE